MTPTTQQSANVAVAFITSPIIAFTCYFATSAVCFWCCSLLSADLFGAFRNFPIRAELMSPSLWTQIAISTCKTSLLSWRSWSPAHGPKFLCSNWLCNPLGQGHHGTMCMSCLNLLCNHQDTFSCPQWHPWRCDSLISMKISQ